MKSKKNAKNEDFAQQEKRTDIIDLILKDHKPLKELVQTLKDQDGEIEDKKSAFEEFAPLLIIHAESEQESLYVHMKEEKEPQDQLRLDGFEGDTEHAIAARLLDDVKAASDDDDWMAKVKVLGELVDHHIQEEEKDILRHVRKEFDQETRLQIGDEYLRLKESHEGVSNAKKTNKIKEARVY